VELNDTRQQTANMATTSINLSINSLTLKPAGKGPAIIKKITAKKARGPQVPQVYCRNSYNKPPLRFIDTVRKAHDFNRAPISSILIFIIVFIIIFIIIFTITNIL